MRRPVKMAPTMHRRFSLGVLGALDDAGVKPGNEFYVAPLDTDLSGDGQARRHDRDTAKRAAKDNPPRRGTQRWRVLVAINELGEAIASDIEKQSGVMYRSLTPRIGELCRGGYVEYTGRVQNGPYGNEQGVIRLTSKGVAMIKRIPKRPTRKT